MAHVGFVLVAVGAVVMIVLSVLSFIGYAVALPFRSPLPALYGNALLALVLGIVAFVGSKHVGRLLWAIVLVVIGYVGGGIGGLLILIGGILWIASRYAP